MKGIKTQTRRVIHLQEGESIRPRESVGNYTDDGDPAYRDWVIVDQDGDPVDVLIRPQFQIGYEIWAKETWSPQTFVICCDSFRPAWKDKKNGRYYPVVFRAGTENYAWGMHGPPKWHSAMLMQRITARLFLEVTDVRAQRLQDIGLVDAMAEGIFPTKLRITSNNDKPVVWSWEDYPTPNIFDNAIDAFRGLWDSINGDTIYSWKDNPWVWAYTFRLKERLK